MVISTSRQLDLALHNIQGGPAAIVEQLYIFCKEVSGSPAWMSSRPTE